MAETARMNEIFARGGEGGWDGEWEAWLLADGRQAGSSGNDAADDSGDDDETEPTTTTVAGERIRKVLRKSYEPDHVVSALYHAGKSEALISIGTSVDHLVKLENPATRGGEERVERAAGDRAVNRVQQSEEWRMAQSLGKLTTCPDPACRGLRRSVSSQSYVWLDGPLPAGRHWCSCALYEFETLEEEELAQRMADAIKRRVELTRLTQEKFFRWRRANLCMPPTEWERAADKTKADYDATGGGFG
mgnify:CR=1 FL=1